MLSVKQGGTKYDFFLWYDSIWDWTLVPRAICEHSTHSIIYVFIFYFVNDSIVGTEEYSGFFYIFISSLRQHVEGAC